MQFCPSHLTPPPASLSRCVLIFISSFCLPSTLQRIPVQACQSVTGVSSTRLKPPCPHHPAPPWLCPEHQPVSVKTLTVLLPARRASDPICTTNSLPGLFCLSLPNTCYLNSKSFFWGLTVSLLFLEFTHCISNPATLFVCSSTFICTHLHTRTCASHTRRGPRRHTHNVLPTPSLP